MAVSYNVKDGNIGASATTETFRTPLWVKLLLIFFILTTIGLAVALIVREVDRDDDEEKCPVLVVNATQQPITRPCQTTLKQNTTLPNEPTVFQELSELEIQSVMQYMLVQPSLDLKPIHLAKTTENLIFSIVNRLPPKSEVINYLHNGGAKPYRRAKVIVINGDPNLQNIVEYVVWPTTQPTNHTELKATGYRYPIPYSHRPNAFMIDSKVVLPFFFIANLMNPILVESFGQGMINCTQCLTLSTTGTPPSYIEGRRLARLQFVRDYDSSDLFVLPLIITIDVSSSNTTIHSVFDIIYGNQTFRSLQEFLLKYQTHQLTKITVPVPSAAEILRASFRRRERLYPSRPVAAPTQSFPGGHRFAISGRKVSYLRWTFEISRNENHLPTIYDIRFNNQRIAYEISLQDALALYSIDSPELSAFQDLPALLGLSFHPLIVGVDCPKDAVYLSASHYADHPLSTTRERIFCVFEYDSTIPARRHTVYDFRTQKIVNIGGVVDRGIIVRAVGIAGNYDYIIDFIMHTSGIIEIKLSSAGYLQTVTSTGFNAEDYGNRVTPAVFGHVHDHHVLFKVDLDIDGSNNVFQTIVPTPTNLSYAYGEGNYRIQKILRRTNHVSESTSSLRQDGEPKYFTFLNPSKQNGYGSPKGYRIYPVFTHKNTYPDDYPVTKSAAWMKYELAVSKYNDFETLGGSYYNQIGMDKPVFDFDGLINNNDTIDNEDIVAWIPLGGLHIPNTEDVPTTVTTGTSYTMFLKPYGFFDEDPTASLQEGYHEIGGEGGFFNEDSTCMAN